MVEPASSAQPIVVAEGLTKVFKDFWMRDHVRAVDQLDLHIRQGQVFGLIGPNGSGKSTTIKMILGLLHKTSGRLGVFGRPPSDSVVKKRIGYLPEESYLYPFLNARETLDFYGKLFGLGAATRHKRVDELLEMVGLDAVQHRPVGQFSKGMQRRVGIGQALINDPDFLILDEPTSGLDPIGIRQVKDLIIELGRRGKTILLSSHLLSEVEDVCDYMVILYGGKKRAEGTADQLLTSHDRTVIETESLTPKEAADVVELIRSREGREVLSVRPARQTLESLFLDIVQKAQAERVVTFGAKAGGSTAGFLRAEPASGEDLIKQLVAENQPVVGPPPESPVVHAGPVGPDSSVLDALVRPASADSSTETSAAAQRQPPAFPPAAPRVDESVISSLLDDSSGPDKGTKA